MPHVMPKWYRDRPNATDQKTLENREDHADLERREFIREQAMLLLAMPISEGMHVFSMREAWEKAREMWDCKPEDC